MPNFSQEQRWDHQRDLRKHDPRPSDLTVSQRFALAKLIGFAEGVVASGTCGIVEPTGREVIAETLAAFGWPSKAERSDAQA
jgi:hypothetical protein